MYQWLLRLLGLAKDPPASEPDPAPVVTDEPDVPVEASGPTAGTEPQTAPGEPRIDLPAGATVAAPWAKGHVVPSIDAEIVRRHLLKHLRELKEEAEEPGDTALVERLERMVTADQLDLPPFPAVARELDALLKQTTTDILQIARVVERDPGMVKRV